MQSEQAKSNVTGEIISLRDLPNSIYLDDLFHMVGIIRTYSAINGISIEDLPTDGNTLASFRKNLSKSDLTLNSDDIDFSFNPNHPADRIGAIINQLSRPEALAFISSLPFAGEARKNLGQILAPMRRRKPDHFDVFKKYISEYLIALRSGNAPRGIELLQETPESIARFIPLTEIIPSLTIEELELIWKSFVKWTKDTTDFDFSRAEELDPDTLTRTLDKLQKDLPSDDRVPDIQYDPKSPKNRIILLMKCLGTQSISTIINTIRENSLKVRFSPAFGQEVLQMLKYEDANKLIKVMEDFEEKPKETVQTTG